MPIKAWGWVALALGNGIAGTLVVLSTSELTAFRFAIVSVHGVVGVASAAAIGYHLLRHASADYQLTRTESEDESS